MGFQGIAALRKAQGQGCSGGERGGEGMKAARGRGSLEILLAVQPAEDCGPLVVSLLSPTSIAVPCLSTCSSCPRISLLWASSAASF